MTALAQHIAQPLLAFVEPQIEQLHIQTKALRCGVLGTVPENIGSGYVWALSLDNDCLIASHHLEFDREFLLEECPTEYSCICCTSCSSLELSDELHVPNPTPSDNIATFSSKGGSVACLLKAHVPYDSVSISYTPSFIQKIKVRYPGQFDDLEDRLNTTTPEALSAQLRTIMRSIDPNRALLPGSELFFRAKALEAISLIVSYTDDYQMIPPKNNRSITKEAKHYIEADLSRRMTLDDIAKHLFVSRSKLCSQFQHDTGMGVATYIRMQRISQAKKLLIDTALSISDVGTLVGYSRASTFTDAFLRETNHTPTEWRSLYAVAL